MHSIQGIKTKLVEISDSDAEDIIKLRNDPANNKFLFQHTITLDDQLIWINKNKNRTDTVNFKVTNLTNEFKGTISVYNIVDHRGEFGRYIVTNPINAIEAEYLLLQYCFGPLGMKSIYCQTNIENKSVWGQHIKLGFREKEMKEVRVGSNNEVIVQAIVQEISAEDFRIFSYDKIIKLIRLF